MASTQWTPHKMIKRLLPFLLLFSYQVEAAITFIGGDTDFQLANTTSLTVVWPSHQADDVGIICAKEDEAGTVPVLAVTVATGYTLILNDNDISGSDRVHYIWYKKFTSSSETNPVITTDTTGDHTVVAGVFRGVDTTVQIDATTTQNDAANTDNPTNAAIATATANAALVLCYGAVDAGNALQIVAPAGYTDGPIIDATDNTDVQLPAALAYDLDVGAIAGDDPGAWQNTGGAGTADVSTYTIALRPASVASVTFTSGPTVAAAANGYTISGTIECTGTCTVYAASWPPAVSPPADCNAVEAASGALIAANEAWTTATPDSFALTETGNIPRQDVYVCGSDGTTDTAVTTSADTNRTANSGKAITVLASVASTSVFALATDSTGDTTEDSFVIAGMTDTSDFPVGGLVDFSGGFADLTDIIATGISATSLTAEIASSASTENITVTANVYFNPTIAAGDVIEGATTAVCAAGSDAVTWETDGDLNYTATTCGTTLTTIDYCPEDVTGATGLTTTPGNCFTTYDKIYLFNSPPDWDNVEGNDVNLIWNIDEALSGVDFANYCTDVDAHTMAFAYTGTPATGVTFNSDGTVTGTPTVEDEAGAAMSVLCNDPGQLYARKSFTQWVIDTYTAPDCTDANSVAECLVEWDTAAHWYGVDLSISVRGESSLTVATGDIISQIPVELTEVDDPLAPISVVISLGLPGKGGAVGIQGTDMSPALYNRPH